MKHKTQNSSVILCGARKSAVTMALLISSISTVYSGPFDLKMGMKIEEIDRNAKDIGNNTYKVKLSSSHKTFDTYTVSMCPSGELYMIRAVSGDITTNSDGTELRSTFSGFKNKYKKAYGSGEHINHLSTSSPWTEKEDWMVGLIEDDRTLRTTWDRASEATLSDNVTEISLEALPIGINNGYILLSYKFSNYENCKTEQGIQ